MERREKLLAIVAGGLLALVVGVYLIKGAYRSIVNASAAVENAKSALEDAEILERELDNKTWDLDEWQDRSLPGDVDLAKNEYPIWLNEQATFQGQQVQPMRPPTPLGGRDQQRKPGYYQLTYKLNGNGTLEDLTNFLYNFYSVNTLHRIKSLNVTPNSARAGSSYSEDLSIAVVVEAIAMRGTPSDRDLAELKAEYWQPEEFDLVVKDTILDRNLFNYNAEPTLFDVRRQRVGPDDSEISFNVRAEDPEGRQLRYSLQNEPRGMSIDSRGQITFRPRDREEDTSYEDILVMVEDIGMKSRQVSKMFSVDVAAGAPAPDPPEETPFDITKYTVITSLGDFGNGPEVWIDNRPEGQMHKLHANETIEIGEIEFTVVNVDLDGESVTIAAADKERVLTLGDNLTGFGTPLQTAFQPTASRRGFGNRGGFGSGGFGNGGNGGPPTNGRGGFSRGGSSQRGGGTRGSGGSRGRGRRGGGE